MADLAVPGHDASARLRPADGYRQPAVAGRRVAVERAFLANFLQPAMVLSQAYKVLSQAQTRRSVLYWTHLQNGPQPTFLYLMLPPSLFG